MAITWGTTTLNIVRFGPNEDGELYIREHPLVPDPTVAGRVAQSVLQAFGRNRIKKILAGYGTKAEVATFVVDKNAATPRTLTLDFDNSFVDIMIITSVRSTMVLGADEVFYEMELIET